MSKKASRYWNIAGVLAGAAVFWFALHKISSISEQNVASTQDTVASTSSAPRAPLPFKGRRTRPTKKQMTVKDPESLWRAFTARFGDQLKATKGERGKVVAIQGTPGSGERAARAFDPRDSASAIARAREVLDAASELLGLDPDSPLGDPLARTGAVSAQVYFPQTQDGVAVEPFGSVTVDLGPQGEVLGVASDYVGNVPVTNHRTLSTEQAQLKAESTLPDANPALSTLGGRPILWVSRSGPDGGKIGRHAYDFNIGGRQVVVDADNGAILHRRDHRQL